jgi:hypothetical protein
MEVKKFSLHVRIKQTDKLRNAAHTLAQTEKAGEDVLPWVQLVMDHHQANVLGYPIRSIRYIYSVCTI